MRGGRRKAEEAGGPRRAGLDADAIAAQFTSPPTRVRAEAKAKLRAEAEALLPAPTWGYASSADSFYPPVAVLASEGAGGLGTWYAVRVAQSGKRERLCNRGSKVRAGDFPRALLELWQIRSRYR